MLDLHPVDHGDDRERSAGILHRAGDVPSFPVLLAAYAGFFTGISVVRGTGNPQLGGISIRCVDTGARIVRVRVHAASLEVWLDGSSLARGYRLSLTGGITRDVPCASAASCSNCPMACPAKRGFGSNAARNGPTSDPLAAAGPVRQEELDGRGVLIAQVPPGNGTLHALVIDANKPEYYVRHDGTTYYARPEELATIVGKAPT